MALQPDVIRYPMIRVLLRSPGNSHLFSLDFQWHWDPVLGGDRVKGVNGPALEFVQQCLLVPYTTRPAVECLGQNLGAESQEARLWYYANYEITLLCRCNRKFGIANASTAGFVFQSFYIHTRAITQRNWGHDKPEWFCLDTWVRCKWLSHTLQCQNNRPICCTPLLAMLFRFLFST